VKLVTPSRAADYKRRSVYYRTSRGDYVLVTDLRKHRPNWQVTLADGRQFYVDPSTRFYATTNQREHS
jgi:hypothetical protein